MGSEKGSPFSNAFFKRKLSYGDKSMRGVAQTNHFPFDRLRANGGELKSYGFSVHAELVEA